MVSRVVSSSKIGNNLASALILVLTLVAIILSMEVLVDHGIITSSFIPAPSAIAISFPAAFVLSLGPLRITLMEVLLAFLIAFATGIGLGVLVGSINLVYDGLSPYLTVLYGTPKILFLPIFILVLGLKFNTVLLFAVLEACIPTTILMIGSVRDVDRRIFMVARSMGASRTSLETKVLLPAILPSILDVARICLIFSFTGVLIAQLYIGLGGIGFLLSQFAYNLRIPQLYSVAALLALIVLASFFSLQFGINRISKKW